MLMDSIDQTAYAVAVQFSSSELLGAVVVDVAPQMYPAPTPTISAVAIRANASWPFNDGVGCT